MTRPHIEFIHSQHLPWLASPFGRVRPGVRGKWLSADPATGAASLLMRYPAGWRQDAAPALAAAEEVFVLDGALDLAGTPLATHDYAYLPAGLPRGAMTAPDGAIVLTFVDRAPEAADPDAGATPLIVESLRLPWDDSFMDPNVLYLRMARKNLRVPGDGSGRTYLLGALPQALPPDPQPKERHPFVEESFMIAGDLTIDRGVMRRGAYFWRPPGLWHGGMATLSGYLMLIRTPGADRAINDWSEARHACPIHVPYDPIVPDTLRPFARPADGEGW